MTNLTTKNFKDGKINNGIVRFPIGIVIIKSGLIPNIPNNVDETNNIINII